MTEKIEKRIEEVCERMLFSARSELYLHLRFLDVALSMFSYALEPNLETIGSDGRIIYYNPAYLGGIYRQGRMMVNRAYYILCFTVFLRIHGKIPEFVKKGQVMSLESKENPDRKI